jgi:hypothetical protein
VAIVLGLGLTGLVVLAKLGYLVLNSLGEDSLKQTLTEMAVASSITTPTGLYWFLARLILEGSVGLLLLAGSILITVKQVRRGMILGYYGLLLSLTTVDLLLFYYDQFSTIVIALLQFAVLMAVIYYRRKFQ